MTADPGPDFLIIGAPKAGTTALHSALAAHPEVFVTDPKEPKYWLCDDAPPPAWRGPGDAHSQQEWIWRRRDYDALFGAARPGQVRGESTPFYLWSRAAHRRLAEARPRVRLIIVVRDPIDRAYSNWMHLWSDGLEPVADFETAFGLQDRRVARGWAPFWRYRDLGRYGEQLQHLRRYFPAEQIKIVRYREVIDTPAATVDSVCEFLGIATGKVSRIARDNARPYVAPGPRAAVLGRAMRAGAALGAFAPPEIWRAASVPQVGALGLGRHSPRPRLTAAQRWRLLPAFADDVELLSRLSGRDFTDWLTTNSKGSFAERSARRAS